MRMAELSRRTGVPVATIKYYLREGLLPAGERTAANQAEYGTEHVERIQLIRALKEIARLPLATISEIVGVIDRPSGAPDDRDLFTLAFRELSDPLTVPPGQQADYERAAHLVDDALRGAGWPIEPDSHVRAELIRGIVALDEHFPGGVTPEALARHATLARELAEFEIPESWDPASAPTEALRYAVLGTLLYEPILLAFRRLAHANRHRALRDR